MLVLNILSIEQTSLALGFFQIIWIKKEQLRHVCQALHACYVGKVGVHLTYASYSSD